jgi:hypothetical protein
VLPDLPALAVDVLVNEWVTFLASRSTYVLHARSVRIMHGCAKISLA